MTKYDEWWLADYFRKSRDSQKEIYEEHLEFLRGKYKLLREQHAKAVEAMRDIVKQVDEDPYTTPDLTLIESALAAIEEPTDA